jgi:hypothetical protein
MSERHLDIGVIVARRKSCTGWVDSVWVPAAALAAAPELAPGAFLGAAEGDELYYAGAGTISLYSSETSHYRDNIRSSSPSVWVALKPGESFPVIQTVTVDPYEGEALAEIYGAGLDALPMPASLRQVVSEFVAHHHVERTFVKRRRT